tara:strand:- start:6122 stop:7237 length:1116 start_codon:yes stop_codon:yes gene_type:complete
MGYNQMLFQPSGALDPYGMQGGEFQQNPEQLLTDGYNQPSANNNYQSQEQPMLDPQRMAWAQALSNIGSIWAGQPMSNSVGGAYAQAKAQNDKFRQNKAALARQGQQDELMKRYRESQIYKNNTGNPEVTPSSVKEYKFFSELTPEDQEHYLTMKRANPYYNMNDVQMRGNQLTPTGTPLTTPGLGGESQPELQRKIVAQQAEAAKIMAAAESAQKTATEYFNRLEPIQQGIANLNKGIELLESGADTGPISSFFPSFERTAIELDQLQNVLGLDVVGNTTFGALSKGELDLALATAIPDKLNEDDLKQWMINRRDSQIKLRDYLENAAIYLNKPGNTQASFLELMRESKKESASNSKPTRVFNPETGKIE